MVNDKAGRFVVGALTTAVVGALGFLLGNFNTVGRYDVSPIDGTQFVTQIDTSSGLMRLCGAKKMANGNAERGLYELDYRLFCGPWGADPKK